MQRLAKGYTVYLFCWLSAYTAPAASAASYLRKGEPTAAEAARPAFPLASNASGAFALADTTGYDFPEEEESDTKKLVKDVALWVVVAGFVAFFVIKVFLQGDTDEPPPEEPGKNIPPFAIVPLPAESAP